jgi:flagellar biosynthesis/type III secretory pathway M-ring protein FliF/YscJ
MLYPTGRRDVRSGTRRKARDNVTPDIAPLASHFWQFIDHWQALLASILVIVAAAVFAFVLHRQMRQTQAAAAQQEAAQQKLWAAVVEATDRHVAAALAPAATAYDAVQQRLAELRERLEAAERRTAEEAQRAAAALADLRQQLAAPAARQAEAAEHIAPTDAPVTDNAPGEDR